MAWRFVIVATAVILAGGPASAQAMQQRFLLNNDGTNLFYRDDLSLDVIARHVDECTREITTYLLCPNGHQKLMYPSALEEVTPRPALKRLIDAGVDPFGFFLGRARQRGFEVFVTYRMNEVHNVDTPQDPLLCSFWRDHPEYHVDKDAPNTNWMAHCLDYSQAPVRERTLAILKEIMDRYSPDGIELDWMRFPRHLSGNDEQVWQKRDVLTEFMAAVRKAATEREKPVLVSVRIPTSLEGCKKMGIDIAEWNRRGVIDFATLAAFLSTDFTMPIAAFREALAERPIPLYASIEIGFGGDGQERKHSEPTLRAAAAGLRESGADGLYLFNFPCWRETVPDPPYHWLPQLAQPVLTQGRPFLIPIVTNARRVAGVDLPTQLPADLVTTEVRTFNLYVPALPLAAEHSPRAATLLVAPKGMLKAAMNGAALARVDNTLEPNADSFEIPVSVLSTGENHVELTNESDAKAHVTRIDVALRYE